MSNLFRKKSLERISSPEQLNEYVKGRFEKQNTAVPIADVYGRDN